MRKKILLIIICLFSLFGFINEGKAAVDYSLNYDITKFELKNNDLTIEGWAFINNANNEKSEIRVYLDNDNNKIDAEIVDEENNEFTASFKDIDNSVQVGSYKLVISVQSGSSGVKNENVVVDSDVVDIDESSCISVSTKSNVNINFNCDQDDSDKPNEVIDSVCVGITDISFDGCSDSIFKYDCNAMKIKTGVDDTVVSALVSINEKGDFRSNDYSDMTVMRGRSFDFSLNYIYSLNWEFNEIKCNGISDDRCKDKLKEILMDSKYFGNATDSVLESRLSNSVSEASGYSFVNDGNFSSAGKWRCESYGGISDGDLTIICDYKINDAYINYYTNYITYANKDSNIKFTNLGSHFFIPLNYSKNEFRWKINTENLSLINLRTVKNNYNSTFGNVWKVNTVENGNKCRIGIEDGLITNDGYNLIYKSIDESIGEKYLYLYYINEDTNWHNYFYKNSELNTGNLKRINNAFNTNNLHYVTKILSKPEIGNLLHDYGVDYTKWNNITFPGYSSLVTDNNYFEILENRDDIHCRWGEYDAECDKHGG